MAKKWFFAKGQSGYISETPDEDGGGTLRLFYLSEYLPEEQGAPTIGYLYRNEEDAVNGVNELSYQDLIDMGIADNFVYAIETNTAEHNWYHQYVVTSWNKPYLPGGDYEFTMTNGTSTLVLKASSATDPLRYYKEQND